jgi:hypothetical protein
VIQGIAMFLKKLFMPNLSRTHRTYL